MVAFSLNQDLTREDQMENPPEPLLSNDDLFEGPIVAGELPEELNKNLAIVAALESRITDLCYLVSDMKRAGGMSKSFALEAARIDPKSVRPIGFYSEAPSATQYKVSLESFTAKISEAWKRLMNVLQVIFAKAMSLAKQAMKSPEEKKEDEIKQFLGLAKTKAKEAANLSEKVKEATGNETAIDRDAARFGHMFNEMAEAYDKVDPQVAKEYREAGAIFGAGPKPATESYDNEAIYAPAQYHIRNSIEWAQNKLPNILRKGDPHECHQARVVAHEAAVRIAETHLNFRKGGQLPQSKYDNYQNHITQFRDELVRNFGDTEDTTANVVLNEVLNNYEQGTIVTEGFMDFVRNVFMEKPDFERKPGRLVDMKKVAEYVKKYFLDPSWVSRQLTGSTVTLGEKDATGFNVDNRIVSPISALQSNVKEISARNQKYGHVVKRWFTQAEADENAAQKVFKDTHDMAKVEGFLEQAWAKNPVPKEVQKFFTENQAKFKGGYARQTDPLPVLDQEGFIALAKETLKAIEIYASSDPYEKFDWVGSYTDSGMWEDADNWEGHLLRTGDAGDYLYFQAAPSDVFQVIYSAYRDLGDSIKSSLAYLFGSTKGVSKHFATEGYFVACEAFKINIGIRMITKIVELIKALYEKISNWVKEKFGSGKTPSASDAEAMNKMGERMAQNADNLAEAAGQYAASEAESMKAMEEAMERLRNTQADMKTAREAAERTRAEIERKVKAAREEAAAAAAAKKANAAGDDNDFSKTAEKVSETVDRMKATQKKLDEAMEKLRARGKSGKVEPMQF